MYIQPKKLRNLLTIYKVQLDDASTEFKSEIMHHNQALHKLSTLAGTSNKALIRAHNQQRLLHHNTQVKGLKAQIKLNNSIKSRVTALIESIPLHA